MKAENVIGPVSIIEKPRRDYLGIRLSTPFGGMFAVITQALKELRKWSKQNGLAEEGPYFVRYYHCDMQDIMEVEAGLMTSSGHPGQGRIKPGVLPSGKYAALIYRGNGLRGNQAMMKWAADNRVRFEPIDPNQAESYTARYEAYLTDYRIEPRKLLWDVELAIKIVDG